MSSFDDLKKAMALLAQQKSIKDDHLDIGELWERIGIESEEFINKIKYEEMIHQFIAFLVADMAIHKARESSKRMDIHKWMIQYLREKLEKMEKDKL